MSKKSSNSHEDVETPTNGDRGGNLKRRTFAKGAGASLALASSLGAMGTGAAETHDDSLDDDDSPGDDSGLDTGLDNQFRQMDKELYVAALAADQDENGDLSGGDNQNGGAGVAVFEAPEEQQDDVGDDDDNGFGDDDEDNGLTDDNDNNDVGVDDDNDVGVDDDDDTGPENGSSAEHEVDSLDYHVFIMDADNVGRVTLNDNTSDEEVEELADLSQDVDDDNDVGADDDNDVGADDDNDVGADDDNDVGADDDMGQGVSGTIEEPIVVAGSLGQGAMDSDLDDDDDDDPAQDNGEFDLEDFRQNPWDYYVAVHGDDDEDNGLTDDNDNDDNGLTDDNDNDDNGLTDDNDNDDSEIMLRGRVTTGLLEDEEEPGDRVDDDDDDVGVDDDDDTDVGDDDDGFGDDDDDGFGDDDDDGFGDDDDDNGGLFD